VLSPKDAENSEHEEVYLRAYDNVSEAGFNRPLPGFLQRPAPTLEP